MDSVFHQMVLRYRKVLCGRKLGETASAAPGQPLLPNDKKELTQ